ncbi:MAG TPA: nitrite reductase (NAD(P)H) small subunit [Porticoccaceae bacterium]|nr:nitrite reductase (NAD(P)H) small subunit [Porticoccaceae bacterium]
MNSSVTQASTTAASAAESNWIEMCQLDDLPYDAGVAALLHADTPEEVQIALFRVLDTDTVYATGNYDPFSHANVLARGILCSIGDELAVASPILKQHFSLTSGQCLEDEGVRIAVYPVEIRGKSVFVKAD